MEFAMIKVVILQMQLSNQKKDVVIIILKAIAQPKREEVVLQKVSVRMHK